MDNSNYNFIRTSERASHLKSQNASQTIATFAIAGGAAATGMASLS